ncbi:MAG TPA: nucleotidyltransferase domain-containing protein [Acetobacteraceae bacterium]|nr:nucleotidyltransferase domain-containing protein [Acetobacteraceae bacterium]
MERIVTLSERKATETERRQRSVETLRPLLVDYAREHGGRFLLYGSSARNQMRYDSDVDLLTDFGNADADDEAWRFAERACWNLHLEPDIRPLAWCTERFLTRVKLDMQVLA